jgi:hypothetical protein
MVIGIDPGDLRKKYANKMEFLGRVWDGSEQEVSEGHSLCKAVAMDMESKQVIPLYCEAYSSLAEGFKSENAQLLKLIDTLFRDLGDRGIHAYDRGGDQGVIYDKYLGREKPQRFVIRLKDRDLVHRGRRRNCWDLAKVVPTPYETALIVYEKGRKKKRTVQYNALGVKLSGYDHRLFLVMVKRFGVKPMMLLTSCAVERHRKQSIWRIVEYYLARWKCDESYRFIKQCYHVEDVSV